ncbi:hypothetical protein [Bacillus sp. SM2101]|uniref:hypothetical protein n=1 Tax=Bacillus sp. SM2101 TaxID=2805366 RepID=UPI001BDF1A61|nr:hypothetical protein [Bacillus sp. SM2101]
MNRASIGDIIVGWTIVIIVYILTYLASATLFVLIFQRSIDQDWRLSGIFIGFFLIVIPYLSAGIFVRKFFSKPYKVGLLVSIVPWILEKVIIYGVGAMYKEAISKTISSVTSTIAFIRGDAGLPYFTSIYCILGLLSIFITVLTATYKKSIKLMTN